MIFSKSLSKTISSYNNNILKLKKSLETALANHKMTIYNEIVLSINI